MNTLEFAKVIENTGLGISVYDIVRIDDPYVYPGEGGPFVQGMFSMMIGFYYILGFRHCKQRDFGVSFV